MLLSITEAVAFNPPDPNHAPRRREVVLTQSRRGTSEDDVHAALTQEIERHCEASQCMRVGEDELALRA